MSGASREPNIGRVSFVGAGLCGYTPSWQRDASRFCRARAVYEIRSASKDETFHVCAEHAAWARAHPKNVEIARIATLASTAP